MKTVLFSNLCGSKFCHMLLFNLFVINLTDFSVGDASKMRYVPIGTERFIVNYTTFLRAVRYFSSIGKKFILFSDKHFRISLCSTATSNLESLLCVTIHVLTTQKKSGVAMCFVILCLRPRFNRSLR
jgi:hypothetical protein